MLWESSDFGQMIVYPFVIQFNQDSETLPHQNWYHNKSPRFNYNLLKRANKKRQRKRRLDVEIKSSAIR
jgi:hypothetical protein